MAERKPARPVALGVGTVEHDAVVLIGRDRLLGAALGAEREPAGMLQIDAVLRGEQLHDALGQQVVEVADELRQRSRADALREQAARKAADLGREFDQARDIRRGMKRSAELRNA